MLQKLRNVSYIILACSLLLGCVNQNGSSTSQDIKVVATSVAVTEILDALDVPSKQVVGIPQSDNYTIPETYKDIKTIGNAMSPDLEVITNLKPSLILSPNSLEGDLASKYEKANIESAFLNLKSVSGMYKSIEDLGKILDKEEKANELVDSFVKSMNEFQQKHQDKKSPKVLILMGLPGSYVVATESSYVGDLVKLAGGTNVYGDGDGTDFLNVNVEDMLKQNPDIILRTSHALPEQVKTMFANEFSENAIWRQFDAVKNKKVYDLENQYFGMSANFQYIKALEKLEALFYENN